MNDDDLFRTIVKAARAERAARDPSLERVTHGEATDDELRALEEQVADDEAAARRLDRHRPLDAAAHDRIAAAILGAENAEKGSAEKRETSPQRSNLRRLFYALPPLAAAAILLLFFTFRSSDAFPVYELSVRPASDVRLAPAPASSSSAPVRLHPSSTLDLVLRPQKPVSGAVAVRAALVRDGRVTAWSPAAEMAEGGAVRVRGRVDTIVPDANGTWVIVIAVAHAEALPSADELAANASASSSPPGHDVQYLRATIEIVSEP